MDHQEESARTAGRQTWALIWLGLLLLVSFTLPTVEVVSRTDGDGRAYLFSFDSLREPAREGVRDSVALFWLFPGVAGIAVLFVALTTRPPARSIAVTLLGLMGYLLLVVGVESLGRRREIGLDTGSGDGRLLPVLLPLAATACLLAGSRAGRRDPRSLRALVVGVLGAVLYLVHLAAPTMPDLPGGRPIALPFELLKHDETRFAGIGHLLGVACTLVAAGLCLACSRRRGRGSTVAAGAAWWLVVGGILATSIGLWASDLDGRGGHPGTFLAVTSLSLKWTAMLLAIRLTLPVGLSELLVPDPIPPPKRA